jgi:hypothetical protein
LQLHLLLTSLVVAAVVALSLLNLTSNGYRNTTAIEQHGVPVTNMISG